MTGLTVDYWFIDECKWQAALFKLSMQLAYTLEKPKIWLLPPRPNPVSDSHTNRHRWLHRGPLHLCKSSSQSAHAYRFRACVTLRTVTKAPGRAVATEGRCVRAGRNESQRRLSSAVSPVYSTRTIMHFDTMRSIQRSFIRSTTTSPLYRVPAAFAPRDSEPAIACSLI